jgi:hypothetical protein
VNNEEALNKIEAESVVIEVIDQDTGKVFRRTLPIKYLENSNGLILSGETLEGNPSQIAFLSETAFNKINDLRGKGPDSPRCKD